MSRPPKLIAQARSLPFEEWPPADRAAWEAACRPAQRLKRGGAASHLKEITRRDLVRRYGYFLDYLRRVQVLPDAVAAAGYVTPERVEPFVEELRNRVGSVTLYATVYKVRRMAQLLAPEQDFTWLCEIEKDLALVMRPKSKADRLVYANVLVEAGMTLMVEAEAATHRSALARARQYRNGLMVAMLALHPLRLKNFSALEIGSTFGRVNGAWWIILSAKDTKENRPDERQIVRFLVRWIERYLDIHRPILARNRQVTALWLSSNDGGAMTYSAVERAIDSTTLSTVGIKVCPHLFRASAVS